LALAAEPLKQPVIELPFAPEALVPVCALALAPLCPVLALLDAPMPAPDEEVPVELGLVALGFEEP
jgi:hypothetical protein